MEPTHTEDLLYLKLKYKLHLTTQKVGDVDILISIDYSDNILPFLEYYDIGSIAPDGELYLSLHIIDELTTGDDSDFYKKLYKYDRTNSN